MNYILTIILLSASFLFTVISLYTDNNLMKIIAGTSFLFLGLMMIISGVDIQTGTNIVTDMSSNVTQITNQTSVFTNQKDIYTNGFSLLFIIIGLFLFLSSAWGFRSED